MEGRSEINGAEVSLVIVSARPGRTKAGSVCLTRLGMKARTARKGSNVVSRVEGAGSVVDGRRIYSSLGYSIRGIVSVGSGLKLVDNGGGALGLSSGPGVVVVLICQKRRRQAQLRRRTRVTVGRTGEVNIDGPLVRCFSLQVALT